MSADLYREAWMLHSLEDLRPRKVYASIPSDSHLCLWNALLTALIVDRLPTPLDNAEILQFVQDPCDLWHIPEIPVVHADDMRFSGIPSKRSDLRRNPQLIISRSSRHNSPNRIHIRIITENHPLSLISPALLLQVNLKLTFPDAQCNSIATSNILVIISSFILFAILEIAIFPFPAFSFSILRRILVNWSSISEPLRTNCGQSL